MINKQSLWFLTLFSIILVLAVYYVSMPNVSLSKLANVKKNEESAATISIEESDALAALRVQNDEAVLAEMEDLQSILLNASASSEEKNDAYEKLQDINTLKGQEEKLENLIKEKYSIESFVKIDKDQINIVVAGSEHNYKCANDIIRLVQDEYKEKMYITVKYQ